MLNPLLFITEAHLLDVRGRALECLGHIAVAIGKEHFEQYFLVGLQSALNGTEAEGGLCEYSYTYIANTAKVMGATFNDHLASLVPHLLDVIRESELSAFTDEDDVLAGDSDEDEDDDDSEGNFHLNVEEGFINSKKAALSAIGSLAEHTGAAFFPFLEDTLNTIIAERVGVVYSFHRIIRAEAYMSLQYMLKVACMTGGITEPPAKGALIQMDPVITEVTHVVLTSFLTAMVEDIEMLPASYAIEGLMGALEMVGVAALTLCDKESNVAYGDALVEHIGIILKEKAASQTTQNKDEDDDDEDADHDNLVMDATCDLISGMAKVIGAGFVQYFEKFKKPLLKYTKPSRSYSDRAMVIGCYAEVMKEIGPDAAKYADSIFPVVQVGLTDSMEAVRRNSAYCVGVLAEILPAESLAPHVPQLLQWLHPLCMRNTDVVMTDMGGADVDNALSSVARIMKSCLSAIPIQHVLPVILNAMPLRSDYNEAIFIYEVLTHLIQENEPTALSMMPQMLTVFAQAISEESKYQDEVKVLVVSCLNFMSTSSQHQSVVGAALQQLADQPTVVQTIQAAISP
jgi:importin-4